MATTTIPLQRRYRDTYSVAAGTISWGTALKILGLLTGLALAILGFVAAPTFGIGGLLAALVIAASLGGTLYALGVNVCAQGQLIRAVLDTAVNTSPLLSNEEKRAVIVSGEQEIVAGSAPVGEWFNCQSCGRAIRLDANTNKCYVCNQIARPEQAV